jgi:hypothetical protein
MDINYPGCYLALLQSFGIYKRYTLNVHMPFAALFLIKTKLSSILLMNINTYLSSASTILLFDSFYPEALTTH